MFFLAAILVTEGLEFDHTPDPARASSAMMGGGGIRWGKGKPLTKSETKVSWLKVALKK